VIGCWPIDPNPTWRISVFLSIWVFSFDLFGKGGPTSSYDTAGIALWIIAPHKPPYPAKDVFVKVEIPQGGPTDLTFLKLYIPPTFYLCVLYLSQNKQGLLHCLI
jgi:hypothetical protein